MHKTEYSIMIFIENVFIFYESGREPRHLAKIKKDSIFGSATNSGQDFNQTLVQVINEIVTGGWDLAMVGPGLVWYFKRSGKRK